MTGRLATSLPAGIINACGRFDPASPEAPGHRARRVRPHAALAAEPDRGRARAAAPRVCYLPCGRLGMSALDPNELRRAVADVTRADTALVETHISWVVLSGGDVYKVKKPVDLGFLDFTTAEARARACAAEVSLNQRLSHNVYKGVVPLVRRPDGALALGGEGAIVDQAVHMRRLDDACSAEALVAAGRLELRHVRAIARTLADFHARSRALPAADDLAGVDAVRVNVEENFAQTAADLDRFVSATEAEEIRAFQRRFLDENAALFAARAASGRVRDGHGDLRLEHVYLEGDSVTVIDCIEFSDRFRYGDVAADVAFLAMDLDWHGRVDLGEILLAHYAEATNDFDLYAVVDFYASYRAFVRGKIAAFGARAAEVGSERERTAREQARRYFRLALSASRRSVLQPSVVAVAGLIGVGKSTVAAHLTEAMSAPVVCADRTRKAMLGLAAEAHAEGGTFGGAYDLGFTARVYDEVFRRAGVVLASGRPAIVDASFRSRAMRARARDLARAAGVPFRLVECRAPDEVCLARLAARAAGPSVSDGRAEIFEDFKRSFEPITELLPDEHLVLETQLPLEETRAALDEAVGAWPRGLAG